MLPWAVYTRHIHRVYPYHTRHIPQGVPLPYPGIYHWVYLSYPGIYHWVYLSYPGYTTVGTPFPPWLYHRGYTLHTQVYTSRVNLS